jgi:hypothetical protein
VFEGELTKLASRYKAVHRVALAEREGVAEGFNQNVSLPTASLFGSNRDSAVRQVHRRQVRQLPSFIAL